MSGVVAPQGADTVLYLNWGDGYMGEHVLMVYILYMYLLYCHKNLTSLLVQPARTHPLGKPSPSGPTSSPACPCAPNVSRFGFAYSASDCQLHDGEDYSYLTHAKHMPGPQLKNTPRVTHLSIPVAHPQPRVCPPPNPSSPARKCLSV